MLNVENKKDAKHIQQTKGKIAAVNVGNIGIIKRIKPIPPSFNKTPANKTLPAVGAATCASGNHKWTGIKGILTAKTKNKPQPKIN